MPQVSLYLSDSEMTTLKKQAGAANLSLSAFTRNLVSENAKKSCDIDGWWNKVSGKLTDHTFKVPADSLLDEREIISWE